MKKILYLFTSCALLLSGCTANDNRSDKSLIEVVMDRPQADESASLRWSPKGEKLIFTPYENGLITLLPLGPKNLDPIGLLMKKGEGSENYNLLEVDLNRDGAFGGDQDTLLECLPSTSRGKLWSSFWGELQIPFPKMKGQKALVNLYPVSFWYVEDPTAETPELVLRYSRRGWLEGHGQSEFGDFVLMITESQMDGVFDRNDSWAIAPDSLKKDLFESKSAKSVGSHAWLGNQAFGIDSVLPSGRVIWLKTVDPQITREEEEIQKDWLAVDRSAKRSGKMVNFLHDYQAAIELSKQKGQHILIDFETTWCGPCKTMDQWVYTADTIIAATKNMVAVKVDGDEHKGLVKKYEVSGYPTLIVLNPDGSVKARALGYQSVAKTLALLSQ